MTRKTSIDVYHQIEAEGLLSKRRWQVYSSLFRIGPATAAEIATSIPGEKSSSVGFNVHARLCELRKMGCVEEIGERPCKVTGNQVILWDVNGMLPKKFEAEVKKTRKELEQRYAAYRSALLKIWKDKRTPDWVRVLIKEETVHLKKDYA